MSNVAAPVLHASPVIALVSFTHVPILVALPLIIAAVTTSPLPPTAVICTCTGVVVFEPPGNVIVTTCPAVYPVPAALIVTSLGISA